MSKLPGQSKMQPYQGERSAKAITDWALGLVPGGSVSVVDSQAKLDTLLAACKVQAQERCSALQYQDLRARDFARMGA